MAKILTFSHKNPLPYWDPLSTVKKIDTAKLNSLSLLSYQSILEHFHDLKKSWEEMYILYVAVGLVGNHGTQIRSDFRAFIPQMSACWLR